MVVSQDNPNTLLRISININWLYLVFPSLLLKSTNEAKMLVKRFFPFKTTPNFLPSSQIII